MTGDSLDREADRLPARRDRPHLDDHKAAEASGLAEQAYDAGADLLLDLQNSPVAAAVAKVATARRRLAIGTNAADPTLTRGACSRCFYHYAYDSPAIAGATANYLAAQPDNRRWVMVAADSGFGKGTTAIMAQAVAAHGGTVVSTITVLAATTDFHPVTGDVRAARPDVVSVFRPTVRLTEPHDWFDILVTVPATAAFPGNTACTMP